MSDQEQPTLFSLTPAEPAMEAPAFEPELVVYTVVPRGEFNNEALPIGRGWSHNRAVYIVLDAYPRSGSLLIAKPETAERIVGELNRKARK